MHVHWITINSILRLHCLLCLILRVPLSLQHLVFLRFASNMVNIQYPHQKQRYCRRPLYTPLRMHFSGSNVRSCHADPELNHHQLRLSEAPSLWWYGNIRLISQSNPVKFSAFTKESLNRYQSHYVYYNFSVKMILLFKFSHHQFYKLKKKSA